MSTKLCADSYADEAADYTPSDEQKWTTPSGHLRCVNTGLVAAHTHE
jgi:hypothetical protein